MVVPRASLARSVHARSLRSSPSDTRVTPANAPKYRQDRAFEAALEAGIEAVEEFDNPCEIYEGEQMSREQQMMLYDALGGRHRARAGMARCCWSLDETSQVLGNVVTTKWEGA